MVFRTPLPAWPDQFPGGGMSGCFHPVCCIHTPMVVANNAMVNTFLYLPDTVTCISEIPATNAKTQQAGSDLKPTPAFRSWRPHPLAGRTSATGPRSCKSLSPERLSCSRCSPHPYPVRLRLSLALHVARAAPCCLRPENHLSRVHGLIRLGLPLRAALVSTHGLRNPHHARGRSARFARTGKRSLVPGVSRAAFLAAPWPADACVVLSCVKAAPKRRTTHHERKHHDSSRPSGLQQHPQRGLSPRCPPRLTKAQAGANLSQ